MAKAVQRLFSSIAPKYDFLNHFMSFNVDRRWRAKALAPLKGLALQRVLDLCAGTLDFSLSLEERFPGAQIFAADFALPMLEQGRRKLKAQDAVQLVCADGHHLPFADRSFEAVVCAFGVRNLEKRSRAAGEIRRVLKIGYPLVVLDFFRPEKTIPKLFYQTYGKFMIPLLGGLLSKNRGAYQYLQDSIQKFLTIGEYEDLLKQFGFKEIRSTALSGGIAHRVVAR